MSYNTVISINHDRFREIEKDPQKFVEALRPLISGGVCDADDKEFAPGVKWAGCHHHTEVAVYAFDSGHPIDLALLCGDDTKGLWHGEDKEIGDLDRRLTIVQRVLRHISRLAGRRVVVPVEGEGQEQ